MAFFTYADVRTEVLSTCGADGDDAQAVIHGTVSSQVVPHTPTQVNFFIGVYLGCFEP